MLTVKAQDRTHKKYGSACRNDQNCAVEGRTNSPAIFVDWATAKGPYGEGDGVEEVSVFEFVILASR